MEFEKAFNFMASLHHSVCRTMDRFHIMIGAAISWAIVTCGIMLAIGWETGNPRAIFWVGGVPIIASYLALLHFDRRYHRFEIISGKISDQIECMIQDDSLMRDNISVALHTFEDTPLPGWWASFKHMTWGPYGLVYASLIIVLIVSNLLKP